jgi:hypothetical protein
MEQWELGPLDRPVVSGSRTWIPCAMRGIRAARTKTQNKARIKTFLVSHLLKSSSTQRLGGRPPPEKRLT